MSRVRGSLRGMSCYMHNKQETGKRFFCTSQKQTETLTNLAKVFIPFLADTEDPFTVRATAS